MNFQISGEHEECGYLILAVFIWVCNFLRLPSAFSGYHMCHSS